MKDTRTGSATGSSPALEASREEMVGGKVRRRREGEALRGEVEAEGGSSGEEVVVLRCAELALWSTK